MWYRFEVGEAEKKKKKKKTTIAGSTSSSSLSFSSLPSLTSSARLLSHRSFIGNKPTILQPSYGMGMWRVVSILACLTVAHASVFTEGGAVLNGGSQRESSPNSKNFNFETPKEFDQDRQYDQEFEEYMKTFDDGSLDLGIEDANQKKNPVPEEEYLEHILGFLEQNRLALGNKGRQQDEPYFTLDDFPLTEQFPLDDVKTNQKEQPTVSKQQQERSVKSVEKQEPKNIDAVKSQEKQKLSQQQEKHADESQMKMDEYLKELDELQLQLDREAKNTPQEQNNNAKEFINQESVDETLPAAVGEPQVPQKKGQNEFVSFVEPDEQKIMKNTKSAQVVDKRRLTTSAEYSSNSPRYSSSSLLLLAVGTVLSVGIVGTAAGGAYYLKRRNDTPDDGEYAPYAGTGPGFKKNKGSQGDETLAYKAQLHQYQQAKQKIICGEDAPGIIESDGEDGVDEENNFSVYECPGLAPTGDIEVCNPNFAAQQ